VQFHNSLALQEVKKYETTKSSKAPKNNCPNNRRRGSDCRYQGAFKETKRRCKTSALPKQDIIPTSSLGYISKSFIFDPNRF